MSFAEVAFALPLRQAFTYRIPDELAGRVRPGAEVQPPFRCRRRRGFVCALTDEQRAALEAIEQALAARAFAPILLHGVTASGKTEIYLRAARAAREAGCQTLVLVPEVALGSQVAASFKKRFGARLGVLHSYLPVGERRRNWELARRGALDVVEIGRAHV